MNEADSTPEKTAYYEKRALKVIGNLPKRSMAGLYAATAADARDAVMALIPPGALVARGDSLSLTQVGIIDALKKRARNELLDPFETDEEGNWPDSDRREKMLRDTFCADIFITGTSAITLDGKLVNIDGSGNRVAAMIYGPRKVIIVAGANKIVKDVEEGIARIKQYAAPLNARRHYRHHHSPQLGELPCVQTGLCADCQHPWRICNYTAVIEGAMAFHAGRINVVIVGEELGL